VSSAASGGVRRWPFTALHELRHRPANQLPALDGLRALAVLLVICNHWAYEWVSIAQLPPPGFINFPAFYWGWTGVDLFFVLSGFLIGKQLWGELYRNGSINVGQFVLRRGLRIWPLYYATMLVLLLFNASKAPEWPDWVMLSNYVPTTYARSWSLSTEEQFYLLMPTLLLVFSRTVRARWWPVCVLGLLALVPISRAWTFAQLSTQALSPERISVLMYSAFHLHCEPLLIGLMVAWMSLRRPAWLAAPSSRRVATRVVLCAGALAVTGIALRTVNREVFAYLALGCVYGAALCVSLADRSLLTAVLRWPVWYPIARLSFGMYLNHLILREPADTIIALVNRLLGAGSPLAFVVGLLLAIAASALTAAITFVLVEQPGLAMRDRWLDRRKQSHAVATSPATR
jgi:peptidoglycan/LPS O-acetylase OafA/YrhL